jgi:hypothetical protein
MMHFNQDLFCNASVLPTDLELATIDSNGNRLILTGHSPGELYQQVRHLTRTGPH